MLESHHANARRLTQDPEFQALVKRKNRVSTILTLFMFAAYFGFVVLLAFAPGVLAAPAGNATLGIPLGIGVIIFAAILTGVYVNWANTKYDSLVAHLKARAEQGELETAQPSTE